MTAFTLKVRFEGAKREGDLAITEVVDETTYFFPAERIVVNRCDDPGPVMDQWEAAGSYLRDLRSYCDEDSGVHGQRHYWANVKLVEVVVSGEDTLWMLVTQAWLLGPGGQTIERIAP